MKTKTLLLLSLLTACGAPKAATEGPVTTGPSDVCSVDNLLDGAGDRNTGVDTYNIVLASCRYELTVKDKWGQATLCTIRGSHTNSTGTTGSIDITIDSQTGTDCPTAPQSSTCYFDAPSGGQLHLRCPALKMETTFAFSLVNVRHGVIQ